MCWQDVATAGNVVGTYSQMQSTKNQASYQASIANQNAALADAQAISVGQQGTQEQNQIRQRARQVTGSQKATLSASGLDISAGSPLAILSDTTYLSEQDIQTSRSNTAMNMWGLNNQATNYRNQAKYTKMAGENEANSILLSGLTSAAKQYSTFGNNTKTSNNFDVSKTYPSTFKTTTKNYTNKWK